MSYDLLVEITRNGTVESRHFGAAVVCDYKGNVEESWGYLFCHSEVPAQQTMSQSK